MINIEFDKKGIKDAIQFLSASINTKSPLLAITYLFIEVDQQSQTATFKTTDLETTIICKVACRASDPIKMLVPFQAFETLSEKMDVTLNLSIDPNTYSIDYKSGRARGKIRGISAQDYPDTNSAFSSYIEMPCNTLYHAISQTMIAGDKADSDRLALTGMNFVISGNGLKLSAGDGYRLAVTNVDLSPNNFNTNIQPQSCLVPIKNLKSIKSLLKKRLDTNIKISIENQFVIVFDDTVIVIQPINANFPSIQHLGSINLNNHFLINCNRLSNAISLANMHLSATDNDTACYIKFMDNHLLFASKNSEGGFSGVEIDYMVMPVLNPVMPANDDLSIVIDSKFLSDYLSVANDDNIWVSFENGNEPLIIRDESLGFYQSQSIGCTYIMMPMANNINIDPSLLN